MLQFLILKVLLIITGKCIMLFYAILFTSHFIFLMIRKKLYSTTIKPQMFSSEPGNDVVTPYYTSEYACLWAECFRRLKSE